ncbi:MAG: hypothetical protein MJB57_06040 [Gemmatimonadetes bacterium]|nr:hypothetical protein [Gemmatimonadota bacterium]
MLVDLSHRARWDVQDGAIDELRPFGVAVPRDPGDVAIASGLMINRMNRTQASVWHIGPGPTPATPDDVAVTDTTDANAWIAIVGDAVAGVMEHVTSLDLFEPGRSLPRLIQGPVLGVPCQVVVGSRTGALLTFARGYAQTFADALLDSAAPAGLGTGGERVFSEHVAAMARGG